MNIESLQITNEIVSLIAEIDEFKGTWKALGSLAPDQLVQLQKVATIESIGSSTRIEGSKLTDYEVEILLANLKIQKFETRDQQEAGGYAAAMNIIFQNYKDIPLTENYIKQLHSILLQYSEKDSWHRGNYKTSANNVVALNTEGKIIGVVFETATPFETPVHMEQLIVWARKEIEEKKIHPLLIISFFIVEFLAIHPFQDGNGRLLRIITTYLLLMAGYVYVPYSSLEAVIEQNKQGYYLSLRQTQATLKKENPNWQPWVTYFLKALQLQKQKLEIKLEREHLLLAKLPLLSKKIIDLATARGKITIGEINTILTDTNRNTIKRHLDNLVKINQLVKNGKGKGTWYTHQ
ncbi:Fic family protein [Ferruginibacter sp.]